MSMITDLEEFHGKFDFYADELTEAKLRFRLDLLNEEMAELEYAVLTEPNPEEVVDALIDIIYIAVGTLDLAGVDIQRAWDEVQRANISKERGIKPGREQSGGFDVVKPKGWKAPNLKPFLK